MLKAPPIWHLRYTLVTDLQWSFTHTPDLQDCSHKMSVWSTTVGTHSSAWNTSKVSFWHRLSLHSANNFYLFGAIADLAMHSHMKVPGKKNYSDLHYGWHNTHVKRMTHEQSAQVSTSQVYCWWSPSSKGRLFLIPKVNTDFMFRKGSIISNFSVPCLGSIIPRDCWELSYGITSFNTKEFLSVKWRSKWETFQACQLMCCNQAGKNFFPSIMHSLCTRKRWQVRNIT